MVFIKFTDFPRNDDNELGFARPKDVLTNLNIFVRLIRGIDEDTGEYCILGLFPDECDYDIVYSNPDEKKRDAVFEKLEKLLDVVVI